MINEAFKIITDGIVIAPEAVDLIWLNFASCSLSDHFSYSIIFRLLGYGWPTEKGGPMYWASNLGLNIIMDFLNSKNTINWSKVDYKIHILNSATLNNFRSRKLLETK